MAEGYSALILGGASGRVGRGGDNCRAGGGEGVRDEVEGERDKRRNPRVRLFLRLFGGGEGVGGMMGSSTSGSEMESSAETRFLRFGCSCRLALRGGGLITRGVIITGTGDEGVESTSGIDARSREGENAPSRRCGEGDLQVHVSNIHHAVALLTECAAPVQPRQTAVAAEPA